MCQNFAAYKLSKEVVLANLAAAIDPESPLPGQPMPFHPPFSLHPSAYREDV
jgi:hypothetical protein